MLSLARKRDLVQFLSFSAYEGGGLSPYLGPVQNRWRGPSAVSGGAVTQIMSSEGAILTQAAQDFQVDVPLFYTNGSGALDALATIAVTYKAALWAFVAGAWTKQGDFLWSGASTKVSTIGDWRLGESDVLTLGSELPKGTPVAVYVYATAATVGIPYAVHTQRWTAGGDAAEYGALVIDRTTLGGIGYTGDVYVPIILLTPGKTEPTFVALSDSTNAGTGQTPDANGQIGEVNRFFGDDYACMSMSISGIYMSDYIRGGYYRQKWANLYGTHIINHLGKNDDQAGNHSAGRMRGNVDLFPLRHPGKRIFSSCWGPTTTTSGNTTAHANDPARQTVLAALRAGTRPRHSGNIDLAQTLESGTTGLWAVTGYQGDGLHPNDTGVSAMLATPDLVPAALVSAALPSNQFSLLSLATAKDPIWLDAGNAASMPASSPLSGTLFSLVQGSSFTQTGSPTWEATGLGGQAPAMVFNGSTQLLTGDVTYARPWSAGLGAITLAALFQMTGAPAAQRPVYGHAITGANTPRATIFVESNRKVSLLYRGLDADATQTITSTNAFATDTPILVVAVFDKTGNAVSLYVNGVLEASGTFTSGAGSFSNTTSNNLIHGGFGAFGFAAVKINQTISIDTALDATARSKLQRELAYVAGGTIPATVLTAGDLALGRPTS